MGPLVHNSHALTTWLCLPMFANFTADYHPVAAKSRHSSTEECEFIEREVQRILKEGIIQQSNSRWYAKVVVVKQKFPKKQLAIDYSQTTNKFTSPDSYQLPHNGETVNKMAQYQILHVLIIR